MASSRCSEHVDVREGLWDGQHLCELSAACVDQEKSGVGERQQSVVKTESAGQGSSRGSSRGVDEDEDLSEDGKVVVVVDKRRNALLVCGRTLKRLEAAQVS